MEKEGSGWTLSSHDCVSSQTVATDRASSQSDLPVYLRRNLPLMVPDAKMKTRAAFPALLALLEFPGSGFFRVPCFAFLPVAAVEVQRHNSLYRIARYCPLELAFGCKLLKTIWR